MVRAIAITVALLAAGCGPAAHSIELVVNVGERPANCLAQVTYSVEQDEHANIAVTGSTWRSPNVVAHDGQALALTASVASSTGPRDPACAVAVTCEMRVDGQSRVVEHGSEHVLCSTLLGR